jgi:acetyl esterase/lipase
MAASVLVIAITPPATTAHTSFATAPADAGRAGVAGKAGQVRDAVRPADRDGARPGARPEGSTGAAPVEPAVTAVTGHMASDGFYGGLDVPAEHEATFAYGRRWHQQLDAYWGGGTARRPGVLLLHGGYWLRGDKRGWREFARQFAARGYAAFAVNYRLSTEARWPAQREDAFAALDFLRRNAARFALDPDRIVVVGSSSGGQIAAMVGAYGEGARRVDGVVAISPAASPYLAYVDGLAGRAVGRFAGEVGGRVSAQRRRLSEATVELVGCVPRSGVPACWEKLEESSAVNHVSTGDSPMFLVHSTGDFVPSRHSVELGERLKAVGVPVEVHILPGRAHGGRLMRQPELFESIVAWIARTIAAK